MKVTPTLFFILVSCLAIPASIFATASSTDLALEQAVSNEGAQSTEGQRNGFVCQLALSHLRYMIQENQINHDYFNQRSQQLMKQGGTKTGEIVAYTSAGNSGDIQTPAQACANMWRNSPGHWANMAPYWDNYCYKR